MSNDNLFNLKKRMKPEWYENGPVKTYTKEEIDKWNEACHDDIWAKLDAQSKLKESDIKYLDSLNLAHVETQFSEILEGTSSDSGGETE